MEHSKILGEIMNNSDIDNQYLAIIAKTLAHMCINSVDLKEASTGEKAILLSSLGFSNKDVASLLGTGENSIRALISKNKKSIGILTKNEQRPQEKK
jgi:hypothetical protein